MGVGYDWWGRTVNSRVGALACSSLSSVCSTPLHSPPQPIPSRPPPNPPQIATFSKPTTAICKEAVNVAYELTLAEGVRFERRMFHATFGTEDQKEGMAAFVEKREAEFKDN